LSAIPGCQTADADFDKKQATITMKAGTVLTAQHRMPVWSEVQAGANDPAKLYSTLLAGACVRVLVTRPGAGRLWAQVVPSSCF